jgi:hypothetical protein
MGLWLVTTHVVENKHFYAQLAQIVLEIVHYPFQPWGWNETMMNEIVFYFNLCAPILPP